MTTASKISNGMLTLTVQDRKTGVGSKILKKEGKIPAVYYGPKTKSTPIAVDILLFEKMLQQAGESSVVSLVHGGTHVDVLIHDVVFDAVTDEPTHADFYAVDKDKKVSVHVPIVFTGEDIAAKSGGVLVKVLHELEVEGLPKYLPHDITVDVSSLTTIGGHISIKDISVPAGVIIKMGLGEAVALLAAPKEEKEEEAAPIDLTAIEVEKKGKKEEEGAEGGEEAAKESKS
ncbi:MAG: 50S ribosomal protein L25 [Patescibacteria group bacterium]